jgi:hypothetical protein
MRTIIIAAVLALVVAEQAPAQDASSGNHILPGCRAFLDVNTGLKPSASAFTAGQCVGTIDGLIQAAQAQLLRERGATEVVVAFCAPDGVTMGQMVRVVVKYVDQHPELMHIAFSTLALSALAQAWPCKH